MLYRLLMSLWRNMIVFSILLLACVEELPSSDSTSQEEREQKLNERTAEIAERIEAYRDNQEAKSETITQSSRDRTDSEVVSENDTPKDALEQVIEFKDVVTEKAKDIQEKSKTVQLAVDVAKLTLDMEAERLRQDFEKATLQVVEIGNHLECELVSTDGEFFSLSQQRYEIYWWFNGNKVSEKASQYCSSASLGIGLGSGGPSCPHHIKGALYPYMIRGDRKDKDRFQCEISFPFSMNAQIQKHLANNPFPNFKSDEVLWSHWPTLKRMLGGAHSFKGTELDCGTDRPLHQCMNYMQQ